MSKKKGLEGIALSFFLMLVVVAGAMGAEEVKSGNLLKNGGFEDGIENWWKGESGKIDMEVMHSGLRSLRLEGGAEELYLSHGAAVSADKTYILSVYIKTDNVVPKDAVSINVLQLAGGKPGAWYCLQPGVLRLIKTGGTQDWTKYQIEIKGLKPEIDGVCVYLRLEKDSSGTVWFDDVSLYEVSEDKSIAGIDPSGPLILKVETNKPDTNVFFKDEPVKLKFVAGPLSGEEKKLTYRIKDFWGDVVREDEIRITGKERLFTKEIDFSPGLSGWFKLEAELNTGETLPIRGSRGQGYMTFGILPPPSPEFLRRDFSSPFGIAAGSDLMSLSVAGARWIWGLVHWKYIEPEEGKIDYKFLKENIIAPLKKYNLNAVHSFVNTPRWASTAPEGAPNYRVYPPKEEAWANYIRAMCRFFKTHPIDEEKRVYQTLWEPMYPWGWKGTMKDIVRISRIAYETIKCEDPHSIVLGLCPTPLSGATIAWLKEAFELGAYNWFDALALHAYIPGSPEASNFVENLREIKSLMKKYGVGDKDIWLTEQGWSTATKCTNEEQANWIVRQNIQSLSEGIITHITFYGIDTFEEGFGRTGGHGLFYSLYEKKWGASEFSPKPAYIAYGIMTRELFQSNYVYALDYLVPGVHAYVFERDKKPIIVLWDYSGKNRMVELDVGAAEIKLVDLMGNTTTKKTEAGLAKLNLTESPVYLHGANPIMFDGKRDPFIGFSPERAEIFPGETGVYKITLTNPFPQLFEGRLIIEVPEGFQGDTLRRKIILDKGEKESFIFRLKTPVDAEYTVHPVFLKLFKEDRVFASAVIKAEIKRPLTASIRAAFNGFHAPGLSVTVANKKPVSENAKIKFISPVSWKVAPKEIPLRLKPNGQAEVMFRLDKKDIELTRIYEVTVEVIDSKGVRDRFSSKVNFYPCRKAEAKIVIDGCLKEWHNIVPVLLKDKSQVLRKARQLWKGPEDLSAKIYTAWDETNFYFAAEVKDDVFHQKQTGFPTWQEDSIQLAIDPSPDAPFIPVVGWGRKNYEYNIALTQNGPEVYRAITGDARKNPTGLVSGDDISLAVVRTKEGLIYEMAIPWQMLSISAPNAGDEMGISVAVCDIDADESWMKALKHILWFDGIVMAKEPEKFGRLIFCE